MNIKRMLDSLKEFIEDMIFPLIFVFLIFMGLIISIGYFEGTSKANYLKRTQNIELSWHQAMWLDIEINNVSINQNK